MSKFIEGYITKENSGNGYLIEWIEFSNEIKENNDYKSLVRPRKLVDVLDIGLGVKKIKILIKEVE